MDFYEIKERNKKNLIEIYPDFKVNRSNDLMVRGKSFYAVWNEEIGLWDTDEYSIQRIIDSELHSYKNSKQFPYGADVNLLTMKSFSSQSWVNFRKYMNNISDNSHQLDERLTFSNTEVTKKDYVSKRLPYPLEKGDISAYEELISTLYEPEERAKIEWAIGAIISGDAKKIQKFLVLYGEAGAGKSTILNIIQDLFQGYYTTFEAKALVSNSNSFSTEVFKTNPLVGIQHDGDLSKIEDNTKLNSIVSHEEMTLNEKYKPSYTARINCMLIMATNKPVRITDGKSGIIRRLIDVRPSGNKVPPKKYQVLMDKIGFELGAIAYHCLEVYNKMGKHYYNGYQPIDMMMQTDIFYNFIEQNYYTFKEQDGTTLKQAYELYKNYCEEALVEHKLPKHKFRDELKNYFKTFVNTMRNDDGRSRNVYSGFITDKFDSILKEIKEEHVYSLTLDTNVSILDTLYSDSPAQYASENGIPKNKWADVKTTLKDIDTKKLHYVKIPENHIVIDFDIKDENGNKSFEKNIEEASKWPATYAELSKSGCGVHLHYIYKGDATKLCNEYSQNIEIKVFTGNSALRRKLTKCNNKDISTISSGLPVKGEQMINFDILKNEKALRTLIKKNLNKEIHSGTKPSIDFIYKILEDAYNSGMHYDVRDLRPAILYFATNSTNQSQYCLKLVNKMKFNSEEIGEPVEFKKDTIIFFDVEVFPNLFIVCWKEKDSKNVVKMINPKPSEIEDLLKFKLIGFNNRRYDNHMLYARLMNYNNLQLFELSQRILAGSKNSLFGEAYNLSFADIYDFSSVKQSLKKFEIELGIHHMELGLPWDKEVDEKLWEKVAEYCVNDVVATEAVFNARYEDFIAREILAKLSGLTINDSTMAHAAKIIFKGDKKAQDKFVYTDLSKRFNGYIYERGRSLYKDEETGEGGYVYAQPGCYGHVALLDVASMHPTSIEVLNLFGPYTKNFVEIKEARLAIKHGDINSAKSMLDGALTEYLDDSDNLDNLSYALKIVINSIYGFTSAKFDNPFRDPRNIDNIVAKRGALFMVDLKNEVLNLGYKVAHIKTDSIKIPQADNKIIDFVMNFGKKYGYTFEHEATYEKMCLVNDAVYIAKYSDEETCNKLYGYIPSDNKKHPNDWVAVGTQFQIPYVFKTLFTKEDITIGDLTETKTVTTSMYLDMNENLNEDEHNYIFIGKVGLFCPILDGHGGGILYREKDGKYYAVGGTKGYRWLEYEMVKELNKENSINRNYYDILVEKSKQTISEYCDPYWFASDLKFEGYIPDSLPF